MDIADNDARGIFLAAVERASADRAAFLDEACAGNADLLHRVEALLRAHDELGDFLSDSKLDPPLDGSPLPEQRKP
jgi:hypothetical protein